MIRPSEKSSKYFLRNPSLKSFNGGDLVHLSAHKLEDSPLEGLIVIIDIVEHVGRAVDECEVVGAPFEILYKFEVEFHQILVAGFGFKVKVEKISVPVLLKMGRIATNRFLINQ